MGKIDVDTKVIVVKDGIPFVGTVLESNDAYMVVKSSLGAYYFRSKDWMQCPSGRNLKRVSSKNGMYLTEWEEDVVSVSGGH